MRTAIAQFCADDYRTVAEISGALNRQAATIQRHHIAPMVAAGVLERKYDQGRSHPDQAYRTRRDVAAG